MKVLQLCHKMPFPRRDGGAVSIHSNAVGLTYHGVDLKVFAMNPLRNPLDMEGVPVEFREKTRFEYANVDTRIRPVNALKNLFKRQSYFVERFWSEEWKTSLIRILGEEEFDVIQLEHLYLCLYLPVIREHSKARVVLRPQNVEHQVWKSVLKNETNPFRKAYLQVATRRLELFEKQVVNDLDGILAISDHDAEFFTSYAPGIPVETVPIGFDFSSLNGYDIDKQYKHFPVFYHLGSMDWYPNVQGLKWFVEEVMPVARKRCPGFVFRMAGKKMPDWFYQQGNESLRIDGEVEDSVDYQSDKAILIVPLLSGGGLRAKIIEGMALGKTIISTTIGAAGIPFTDQENILIADSVAALAEQIEKCSSSKDFCREVGVNARRLAREEYDCKSTARQMVRFYDSL